MSNQEELEKPFAIERAKTGRSKCKKCKCPIEKDALRIAKLMTNPFGDGKMKAWHHVTCLFDVFAKQRATTKKIDDPEQDIDGWADLSDEDKETILSKCPNVPNKVVVSKDPERKVVSKDHLFKEFRRLCLQLSETSAYTEKTSIVKNTLMSGEFEGDVILWCKLLLPASSKRIYNLQSKQLIKLFAQIFQTNEKSMLEDLEEGDVAETVKTFFESNKQIKCSSKSVLTVTEVDEFLNKLSKLSKESDQTQHFNSILSKLTSNDLKMIIRLIKHDLRINAGPKHILEGIHKDAYKAYQLSQDLDAVLRRCLNLDSSSCQQTQTKISLDLMTPVLPMLAEACKSLQTVEKKCPQGIFAEIKYDGERVQVHKKGDDFNYFSRSLKPVLPHKINHFKDYIPKAFPNCDDIILDSEILMIDVESSKPLPFGTLGKHKKSQFDTANVCLFIFDCLYYNGENLMDKPIKTRREILESHIKEIPNRIMLSHVEEIHREEDLKRMIADILQQGLEGLVLKDINGKYEPGKRHWLKIKKDYLFDGAMADTADLVVLGAWYGTGKKGGIMSSFLMGCYDSSSDRWLTVTKVSSGHDEATLTSLQGQLQPKMIKISQDVHQLPSWLEANKPMVPDFIAKDPQLQPVWEITGAEFTNQGVHTADGISIRFPRVTRIREDKDWKTATSLEELRKLFQQSSQSIDVSRLLGSTANKRSCEESDRPSTSKKKVKREFDSGLFQGIFIRLSKDMEEGRKEELRERLGSVVVDDEDRQKCTHVVHRVSGIPSTCLQEWNDFPKYVKHVNVSWIDSSIEKSKIQDVDGHAVKIVADYCQCPCARHAR